VTTHGAPRGSNAGLLCATSRMESTRDLAATRGGVAREECRLQVKSWREVQAAGQVLERGAGCRVVKLLHGQDARPAGGSCSLVVLPRK